jgi:hypothetical protein
MAVLEAATHDVVSPVKVVGVRYKANHDPSGKIRASRSVQGLGWDADHDISAPNCRQRYLSSNG